MSEQPGYLGTVTDDEDGDVKVYLESPHGDVVLWWPETGRTATFVPAERDKLRELLDRAAMPGQPVACTTCKDGLVPVDHCNCGSPADESINYAHERLCGWEQCPNGCWDRLRPAPAMGAREPLPAVDMIGPFTDVHGRQAHLGVDHDAVVLAGFPLDLPEARRLHAALGLAIEDREAWAAVQEAGRDGGEPPAMLDMSGAHVIGQAAPERKAAGE